MSSSLKGNQYILKNGNDYLTLLHTCVYMLTYKQKDNKAYIE